MAEKASKIPISIYQVDCSLYPDTSFNDICDIIIYHANENDNSDFKEQNLNDTDFGDWQVKIFYGWKRHPPKWRPFFKEVVKKSAPLMQCENLDSAFVAFIEYNNNVYAISGGHGNFTLQRFSLQNFGMDVLVRLIDKDHKVIKGLQDRSVTGNIIGERRHFRGDQRIADEDQFGKVYNEVRADLDKKILTEIFGFPPAVLKRKTSSCLAKNSFLISKRISFQTLLEIVGRIDTLMENKEPNFAINKVIRINKRNDSGKDLIGKLKNKLFEDLYSAVQNNNAPDFDFCHSDFENFLSASDYKVKRTRELLFEYEDRIELEELIAEFRDKGYLLTGSVEEFKCSFLEAVIQSFDDDDEPLTTGTILDHIHGQILFEGRVYFLLDGEWYIIGEDFIKDLNKECKEALIQTWDDTLITKKFDCETEGEFNQKYIGEKNFLVFDTKVPENIELCDLLYYDDNAVYLVHVKKGFKNSVRELASQINIAAKRLRTDIKSKYPFLKKLEASVKKGAASKSPLSKKLAAQKFPDRGLNSLFESRLDRDIIFCFAFVDTTKGYRLLKNKIEEFDSSIAKYSLLELKREIGSMGYGFRVIQIPK